jgi:hypothetical protein
VLRAQLAAEKGIRAGMSGVDADAIARNIIADIVKCLMVDQTRGNIALSTEQEEFGNAFLVDEASGAVEFCVYVNIMVRTRIDVNNPYSLG